MSAFNPPDCLNRILALLGDEDRRSLAADLAPVDLPRGKQLARPNEPFDAVFFPESGIASIVTISPDGYQVEAGLFGRDGVGPVASILCSDRTPHEIVMQVPGRGFTMPVATFVAHLERSSSLRATMLRFAQTLATQTAYTALSNAVHAVDHRLARWLLMVHDRMVVDDLALTHEFISVMLAVRRPSVTTSLHVLEGHRLIRSERGHITIRDRLGLEEFAGDAYGKPEAEYRRLLGAMKD